MKSSRSRVRIHPQEGLEMDMITDSWVRRCIGVSVVIVALAVLLLAAAPLASVIRWW